MDNAKTNRYYDETEFATIQPKILYFGTPVALVSSMNRDGSPNLAPISSFWALGWTITLGLLAETQQRSSALGGFKDMSDGAGSRRRMKFSALRAIWLPLASSSRPEAFFDKHVAMANATSLHLNPHLSCTWCIALDNFEIAAWFRNLYQFHWRYSRFCQ
jgi:hypothetical protein